MPAIIKNVQGVILRLLMWRSLFYVAGTAISTGLAALSGMNWAGADTQTRIMVIMGILGACFLNYQAFIDQTIARLAKGEIPFADVANQLDSNPPFPPGSQTTSEKVTSQVETKVTNIPST